MKTFTETRNQVFHVVRCFTCGVPFGITAELYRRVVEKATGAVYCPACGQETCWRESSADRRIKQLTQQLQTADTRANTANRHARLVGQRADRVEGSLRATRGVVTRMKNRVSRGVCPCCKRHFANLERHMDTKHPSYATGKDGG